MHLRVPIDLACGGLKNFRAKTLGETEHVDGAVHAGLRGLHRVVLVVDRRGRAREVIDFVDLHIQGKGHVVSHQLEAWVTVQAIEVVLPAVNLKEAIRDGAIMVTIVIFLFLLNFRTTFITLMAMPLSFGITMLTFKWFGISVNSMTLGGLAVAIGMVVDDAIVDVENVFRRLRENASSAASATEAARHRRRPRARCGTRSSTRRSSSSSSSCRCSD